jgi:hypothetical protein
MGRYDPLVIGGGAAGINALKVATKAGALHKERELDDVEQRYTAEHYVLVDDKLQVLRAVKQTWGRHVTTVFPRQGHYARDAKTLATYPPPADISLERIGDLLEHDLPSLRAAGAGSLMTD